MMANIRAKDTKPELIIRKALHKLGFRYRLHDRRLPGHPDLVLPKHNAVVFVHGCFWHGHDCSAFRWPKTREGFWRQKIETNVANDEKVVAALLSDGWRIANVWECALKGRGRLEVSEIAKQIADWIFSSHQALLIRGMETA